MVKELELYPGIENLLDCNGYDYFKEVKLLTRSVDIIAIKKNKVIAIEVKVENWKRALEQALAYRLCAHEVYIAIWKDFQHRIPKKLLKKHRIGLIIVNEDKAFFLFKPRKSKIIHKNIMNKMLHII